MRKELILIIIVAMLVVGAGAFYGGMKYGQSAGSFYRENFQSFSAEQRQQMFQGRIGAGEPGGMGRGAGSNFVSGEVISKDDQSVTVKTADGGSKIVFFSDSTQISKTADGSISDVEVGKTVMVSGKANQDGSITAQSIQIRPLPSLPAK